jgi:hypothetical protein
MMPGVLFFLFPQQNTPTLQREGIMLREGCFS